MDGVDSSLAHHPPGDLGGGGMLNASPSVVNIQSVVPFRRPLAKR